MAITAVSGKVNSAMSLSARFSAWMRGSKSTVSHGFEPLEGRQLLSVPTINPIGPQLAVADHAGTPPGISVLADGSFVLTWAAFTDTTQSISAMQVFKGEPPQSPIDVSGVTPDVIGQHPNIASGADGGFMVVWTSVSTLEESGVTEVFGRAYDSTGNPLSQAFEIGSTENASADLPDITALPGGGFAVTWHQTVPGSPSGVYAQLFAKDGSAAKQPFQVNSQADNRPITLPQIVAGVDGELVVAWLVEDHAQKQTEIHAQRLSPTGFKSGGEKLLTTQPAIFEQIGGHSPTFSFAAASDGTLLFAWDQTTESNPWNVYGQYFDSYLHAITVPQKISGESEFSQYGASLGFASNGAAVVIWEGAMTVEETSGRVVMGAQLDSESRQVVTRLDVSSTLDGSHVDLKPRLSTDSTLGGFTAAWGGYDGLSSENGASLIIRTFAPVPAAEILVTGDGETITNGSTQTSHDDNTYFGYVDSEGGSHTHEFVIKNTGNIDLELGEITLPEGFTLAGSPATLAPGQTGAFEVTLSGEAGIGVHEGLVTIPNNTGDMNPFTFTIAGEVLERKTVEFDRNTPVAQRTFIDDEGNTVVFTLTGPGLGSISFNPRTHELMDLDLEGTTRVSNLSINVSKTKGQGSGYTVIEEIYIEGSLNRFSAAKVDLYRDFTVEGTLNTLVLGDVFGDHQHFITVGGSVHTRTDFTFGRINDLSLETNGYIGNLRAIDWWDGADEEDDIFTGTILSMNITGRAASATQDAVAGDASVNIYTYNTGRPGVGSLIVAGEVYDSIWDLCGYTGTISLGALTDSHILCEEGFGTFTVWGLVNGSSLLSGYEDGDGDDGFVGADAGNITVGGWSDGQIGVNTLKSFSAVARAKSGVHPATQGAISGLEILAQAYDLSDNAMAINSFKVAGFAQAIELESGGNIGAVTLGQNAREFHVYGDGGLKSFVLAGLAEDCELDVLGDIGSVRVGHWTGGTIEARTLGVLDVTGRAKTASQPALAGDIDAHLILHGNLDKRNSNTLGTVRVAGKIHGVDGREVDFDVTGSVGTVTSGSLERLAFTVRAYFGGPQVKFGSLTTGYTDYWDLTAPGVAVGSITVAQWHDGQLFADKLGTLRVTGRAAKGDQPALPASFFGLIELDGKVTTKGNLLGSATIGGEVTDSKWDINGGAGSINVGSADKFELIVDGDLASYTINGQVRNKSNLTVHGVLQSLRAIAWSSSDIHAHKIVTLTTSGQTKSASKNEIAGDFNGSMIHVTGEGQSATALLLGNMTIAGWIGSSVITSTGSIGAIRTSAFIDSTVFAGVNDQFPVDQIPRHKADFANPAAALRSFTVTGNGRPAEQASFINGRVAAGELTNVSIKLVDQVGGEDPPAYGFAAASRIGNYRRLKMVQGTTQVVTVMNKTTPGIYDQDGLYMLSLADADLD